MNEIYDVWGADRHAACVKLYARFPNSPLGLAECMPVSVQKKKKVVCLWSLMGKAPAHSVRQHVHGSVRFESGVAAMQILRKQRFYFGQVIERCSSLVCVLVFALAQRARVSSPIDQPCKLNDPTADHCQAQTIHTMARGYRDTQYNICAFWCSSSAFVVDEDLFLRCPLSPFVVMRD